MFELVLRFNFGINGRYAGDGFLKNIIFLKIIQEIMKKNTDRKIINVFYANFYVVDKKLKLFATPPRVKDPSYFLNDS